MTVKVIIFDFDGTVADTFDAIVNITNRLAPEFGYKQASPEDILRFRNLTSREIIKQSGVSIVKLPFIMKRLKFELNNQIHVLRPIPGIKEALLELNKKSNKLGIITSNDKTNVINFLRNNDLPEIFDFIYSGTTLFGKSKVIDKFLKQNQLKKEEIIYVGDETRDIEAAKRSQIKAIAVTWGFNAKEVLAAQKPDFLIHHPNELISVIQELQKLTQIKD
ncbi:HAD-IA family hydrolase [Argonema antarcticum]|uniref:HAD-IA family hydrolase n=1 Tax=Argonema antarcticum TaxID=2942763 RepID=UPI002013441D|nr:HAD-IA family hydrolase [Argonema antarcticum]MCL1474733.1 HAD-IA family hydrolase [Argonema antarcticum A004/B2]